MLKLLTLNKYRQSPDAFEVTVQEFLKTAPDVKGFKAFENPNTGDVVFQFELGAERTREQEICVIAWVGMDQVEELTNNVLTRINERGKRASFVNVIALSKSPRAMVAVLVEGDGSGSDNVSQQGEAKEQNQGTNAGTDSGTKRRGVRRNRKNSEDGNA